jgi:ornithine carbamoyltransferase
MAPRIRPILPHRILSRSLHAFSSSTPQPSPRHFLSIADLTPLELNSLIRTASHRKTAVKSGSLSLGDPLRNALKGQQIGLTFSKRSTRTRVSTEGAIVALGGSPLFLGKDDIQLGVNESLRDTSIVMSSMMSGIVARVGNHEDITGLAKWSSVPVINALSNDFHPMQTVADYLTVAEAFGGTLGSGHTGKSLGLEGLKIAWVGDSNNVLFDLAIGGAKLGINIAVASPAGYTIPEPMRALIHSAATSSSNPGTLTETSVPEEAIKDADIIVTDTWISMGWEAETQKRLQEFAGYQITHVLAKRAGAKKGWKFMHCLPRHEYEVDDDVFYDQERSLVFPEAENRLWSALSVLEGFVVNKGKLE